MAVVAGGQSAASGCSSSAGPPPSPGRPASAVPDSTVPESDETTSTAGWRRAVSRLGRPSRQPAAARATRQAQWPTLQQQIFPPQAASAAFSSRAAAPLGSGARLAHRVEKLRLGADAQQDRVLRRDVGRVPVSPLTHGVDRRLGGAEQLADLRVAQLVVVLEQPGDGVGAVLPFADRCVAGASGALRHFRGRADGLQPLGGILFAALDILAADLPVGDGVEAANTDCDLAIGDALHLERMQLAERRNLIEGERGVVDQPHRRGLGHQQLGHLIGSFHCCPHVAVPRPALSPAATCEAVGISPTCWGAQSRSSPGITSSCAPAGFCRCAGLPPCGREPPPPGRAAAACR